MSQEAKRMLKVVTREFEEKLIMEVKSHNCLYAKNERSYSNKEIRQAAWEEIASILGKTVEECQKKWTSLRDSFRMYFRMDQNVASGSGATTSVKWVHFQALRFLIPYIRVPADDCGNFNEELQNTSTSSQSELPLEVEVEVEEGYPFSPSPPSLQHRRAKKRKDDEPLDKVLKAIENSGKRKPMEAFFDSIVPQVEHFSARRQVKLQRRFLEVLAEELVEE